MPLNTMKTRLFILLMFSPFLGLAQTEQELMNEGTQFAETLCMCRDETEPQIAACITQVDSMMAYMENQYGHLTQSDSALEIAFIERVIKGLQGCDNLLAINMRTEMRKRLNTLLGGRKDLGTYLAGMEYMKLADFSCTCFETSENNDPNADYFCKHMEAYRAYIAASFGSLEALSAAQRKEAIEHAAAVLEQCEASQAKVLMEQLEANK